ncbi:MAG TPA: hypothetical protein VFC47_05875 [Caulobacteraceae bacterium]|nr:hypothetical protein [Caulobacteraceae bacterium]
MGERGEAQASSPRAACMAPGGSGVYVVDMASVKKGILTPAGEWWKHLRWTKRTFWKGERQAANRDAKKEATGA